MPAAVLSWCLAAGCAMVPSPAVHRPALPLPEAIAQRYELPEVQELRLAPGPPQGGIRRQDGVLRVGDREVSFSVFLPEGQEGRSPFLLVLPILAGGRGLLVRICTDLAALGFATGFAEREGRLFRRNESVADLEEGLRRTVVENRALLSWVRSRPAFDPGRIGLLGISLGGIVGGVLTAVEPSVRAACLCLAGGDLPALLADTTESRVVRWREEREREAGLIPHRLEELGRRILRSDPASLGAYVDPARVFLFSATLDSVVPRRNSDLLWESLGRPRRSLVPLGHYSSVLVYDRILGESARFAREVFAAGGEPPALTP